MKEATAPESKPLNPAGDPVNSSAKLREVLEGGAEELGISLPAATVEKVFQYLSELKQWGEKINLVGTDNLRELLTEHFLDCLAPVSLLRPRDFTLDLGSGAGLPGIPVKLALPEIRMVLLEQRQKKSVFLRQVVWTLGLTGIEVIQGQAETPGIREVLAGTFDAVLSRATGKLREVLAIGPPFLKRGGKLLVFKGPKAEEELSRLDPLPRGVNLAERKPYRFSFWENPRTILVFEKN